MQQRQWKLRHFKNEDENQYGDLIYIAIFNSFMNEKDELKFQTNQINSFKQFVLKSFKYSASGKLL